MPSARNITVNDFDLSSTIHSGQVFRFDELNGAFFLRFRDRIVRLKQNGSQLEYEGCTARFIRDRFDLDRDLRPMRAALSRDPHLEEAIKLYPGLRIMKQDPWECLVSFICSAASNIPRIKKNIDGLCRLYGHPISLNGFQSYSFPEPGTLVGEQKMRDAGLGYRARYLAALNDAIDESELDSLHRLPYQEAKAKLVELPGIGEKIADCVLLFSLGFTEAFPVDVWIKRVMQEYYFSGNSVPDREIRQLAAERFGRHPGYAQQYLYHYVRMRKRSDG
tara:strand:- start:251 stop:1081 length:831 start_codon:yes stop_codon:yes gene_type:complete